jgi:hypothetical protein
MRAIEIDLAEPFEKILETVLSLPVGGSDLVTDRLKNEPEIRQAVRGLYEAANGRHVETKIGLIAIAPPAYALLKAKCFTVTTQLDFLIEAAARLIAESITADTRDEMVEAIGDESVSRRQHIIGRFAAPGFRSCLMPADLYD